MYPSFTSLWSRKPHALALQCSGASTSVGPCTCMWLEMFKYSLQQILNIKHSFLVVNGLHMLPGVQHQKGHFLEHKATSAKLGREGPSQPRAEQLVLQRSWGHSALCWEAFCSPGIVRGERSRQPQKCSQLFTVIGQDKLERLTWCPLCCCLSFSQPWLMVD